jgi:CRP/FNR family cyclic AMP-dependent transcriptional regulator
MHMKMDGSMFSKFGVTYQPNDIIFCEYEPGNQFYFLQEGRVKVTKIVSDMEKTLDIFHAGDIFGEMAILEDQPRSATAIAIDRVKVLRFNKENFNHLLQGNPPLAFRLLRIFSNRIYDAKRRLLILTLPDIESKAYDVFLMLAENQNITPKSSDHVTFSTNIEEIAHWCGEKVNRVKEVLIRFADQGKIQIYEDRIIVKDLYEMFRIIQSKRKAQAQD